MKIFAFVTVEGFGSKLKEIYFFCMIMRSKYFLIFTFIKCVIIKVREIIVLTYLHETEVKTILTVIMKVSKIFF